MDTTDETLRGIETEEEAYQQTRAVIEVRERRRLRPDTRASVSPPVRVPCQSCGRPTSRGMLMTSARGSVCPDCYLDRED